MIKRIVCQKQDEHRYIVAKAELTGKQVKEFPL